MKGNTESTDAGTSTIEKGEIAAEIIVQLGEVVGDIIASCNEILKEAHRRGGTAGAYDAAGHIGNDQVDMLIAGALQAAGLGGVLTVPSSSIRNVTNLAGELRLRIARASVFRRAKPAQRPEPGDSESLDWLRNAGTNPRPNPVGRSMRASNEVNRRLSDHADDEQQQHIARVQSGVGAPRQTDPE